MNVLFLVAFIICSALPAEADEVLLTALHAVGLSKEDVKVTDLIIDDPDRLVLTKQLLEKPDQIVDVVNRLKETRADTALFWCYDLMGVRASPPYQAGSEVVTNFDEFLDALVQCYVDVQTLWVSFNKAEQLLLSDSIGLVDPAIQMTESRKDTLIALGRRVPLGKLVEITQRVMALAQWSIKRSDLFLPGQFETEAGLVIVGTTGDDVYGVPAAFVFDPGGDDVYESIAGVSLYQHPLSVCVDLGGDDTYNGLQGQGLLGIGVVIDKSGSDRYENVGRGIAGIGIVDDREGDDVYRSHIGAQGFGLYGIGILRDGAGNDRYNGGHLVQGVAGPGGVGILLDAQGNDVYEAGGLYRDFRESGAFFQSMAQGFGRGVRPLTSGGLGILLDHTGDDVYRVDYFGQGAAFWGGSGILIDRNGDDRYVARRYAQGAGVHMGVGALVDRYGNDQYDVWGVGQGAGHDLAVGMLFDFMGADAYRASWLSQGAGSANGIGWLDDKAGDDRYVVEREDTQGHGVLLRNYGSIGLFIDRLGQDEYEGRGVSGLIWRGGQYGVGIDWPLQILEKRN